MDTTTNKTLNIKGTVSTSVRSEATESWAMTLLSKQSEEERGKVQW
jgi:hypothetical protein